MTDPLTSYRPINPQNHKKTQQFQYITVHWICQNSMIEIAPWFPSNNFAALVQLQATLTVHWTISVLRTKSNWNMNPDLTSLVTFPCPSKSYKVNDHSCLFFSVLSNWTPHSNSWKKTREVIQLLWIGEITFTSIYKKCIFLHSIVAYIHYKKQKHQQ
jgi:hypothetical protein